MTLLTLTLSTLLWGTSPYPVWILLTRALNHHKLPLVIDCTTPYPVWILLTRTRNPHELTALLTDTLPSLNPTDQNTQPSWTVLLTLPPYPVWILLTRTRNHHGLTALLTDTLPSLNPTDQNTQPPWTNCLIDWHPTQSESYWPEHSTITNCL